MSKNKRMSNNGLVYKGVTYKHVRLDEKGIPYNPGHQWGESNFGKAPSKEAHDEFIELWIKQPWWDFYSKADWEEIIEFADRNFPQTG